MHLEDRLAFIAMPIAAKGCHSCRAGTKFFSSDVITQRFRLHLEKPYLHVAKTDIAI